MNSIAVIINSGSGADKSEEKLRQLRGAFTAADAAPEFFLAHGGETIKIGVNKALAKGHKIIAAAGGDGTVSAVAAELLGQPAVLGILPLGTLNHLAKDLGLPQDLNQAVETLVTGRVAVIDAGCVNGKYFINNSSIGLYPKLVSLREKHRALGKNKFVALVFALAGMFWRYTFLNVRVQVQGRDISLRSPFVFVGNNKYQVEGLNIGTREKVDNGELSVYVMRHSTRWGVVILAWHALFGGLVEHKDFDVYSTGHARIDTRKKFLPVSIDGEVITLPTPLEYSILPGALKVMVAK